MPVVLVKFLQQPCVAGAKQILLESASHDKIIVQTVINAVVTEHGEETRGP